MHNCIIKLGYGLILFIFILSPRVTAQDSHWNVTTDLEYHGQITLDSMFTNVFGNQQDLLIQHGIHTPWGGNYLLDINMEGTIGSFYLDSSLYLLSNGEKDFDLTFENDDWLLEYKPFEAELPILKTTYENQKLDGFRVHGLRDSLLLFSGKKLYQTKKQAFMIFPSKPVYRLFSDPTSGDVVEYSELVLLDGEQLERYSDYKLNYLSGELKFLIPLDSGALVEVQYNFRPTGETVQDTLTGGFYQYSLENLPHSSLGIFYFHEINDDLSQELTVTRKIHKNYLGAFAQISDGSWGLTGEIAFLDPSKNDKNDYAGNLELHYSSGSGNLKYQLTTASPNFTGIGVVPTMNGEKHLFTGDYHLLSSLLLNLNINRRTQKDGLIEKISTDSELSLDYQLNDSHTFSLALTNDSTAEWGEKTSETDYQLGWEYQITDSMILSLKDSLLQPAKGSLALKDKGNTYRFTSEYKQYPKYIPFFGEQWVREFQTDITFRPYTGITLITNLDYLQPFESKFIDARKRLACTLIATPNRQINTRGNFVYYYNPDTLTETIFYDLNTSLILPYDIELTGAAEEIQLNSQAILNLDQNWNMGVTLPLVEPISLSYGVSKDQQSAYLIESQIISQKTDNLTRIVSLDYQPGSGFSLQFFSQTTDSLWIIGSSNTHTLEKQLGFNGTYLQDANQFSYEIKSLQDQKTAQITQTISWKIQFGHLTSSYAGEMGYLLNERKLKHHKEYLDLSWQHPEIRYQPSIKVNYQSLNQPTENWLKYDLALRLTYRLNTEQNIFGELGHLVTANEENPTKDYSATYLKLGLEYKF